MMHISYRGRVILKRILIALLALVILAGAVWGCWVIWLGRYVVYTRDQGALLDFDLPPMKEDGAHREKPEKIQVPIYYNEGENAINTSTELTQMNGYYVETEALQKDIEGVRTQIGALPSGTPVAVTVKSIYGGFFYNSGVSSTRSDQVDTKAMDALIDYLDVSGMYTIALVPALRDREYGLNHVTDGLPDAHYGGGALWSDEKGCYWLDPTKQGTISYLVKIAAELKGLGFDEVVFTDYKFPQDDRVMFDGDRASALSSTAQNLVTSCATDKFAVSFAGSGNWTIPQGRTRLYMENVDPSDIGAMAQKQKFADPKIQLAFLTDLHDTRFEEYSVLRPLSAAH